MDRIRNILVCVDFSPGSACALSQAARISGWNNANLNILHVVEDLVVQDLATALSRNKNELVKEIQSQFTEELGEFVKDNSSAEDPIFEVRIGNPVDEILHLSREMPVDLLVLGTTGAYSHQDDIGTVALKCVRKAETKVLLVRENQKEPFQRVIGCVDFSRTSEEIVTQSARVSSVESAVLELLHVFSPPWKTLHYMAPTRQANLDFKNQFTRGLELQMKALKKRCDGELGDVNVSETLVEHSHHAQGIIERAQEKEADLIVLGTKGKSNLRYILTGNTAERVLRNTPCSVLAVKPKGFHLDLDGREGDTDD